MLDAEEWITVVVPTKKGEDAQKTLQCLKHQTQVPKIEIMVEPEKTAYEARNKGVEKADTVLVAFTDDDCYPHKDWIEEMLITWEEEIPDYHSTVVAVEGETYGGLNRVYPWAYMTCNISYPIPLFQGIGGFDTELSGWRADTDLAWRILDEGYDIEYNPNAKVHHPSEPRSEFDLEKEWEFIKRHPWRYFKNEILRKYPNILRRKMGW